MKHSSNSLLHSSITRWTASLALATGIVTGPSGQAHSLRGWHPEFNVELTALGTYSSGVFDGSGAEIPAYDPLSQRVFVVNAAEQSVDVLDIRDPKHPVKVFSINVSQHGSPNSVAVKSGVVAIAIENGANKQANGWVALYSVGGHFLNRFEAGALPDMVTFTPDGKWILAANEGEPSADYLTDPEGSITAIPVWANAHYPFWVAMLHATKIKQKQVKQLNFRHFNNQPIDPAIRIFGPNATVAQDLEPEYIAVSPDSKTAMVALQENNAFAVLDLKQMKVTKLVPLGFKDHGALTPLSLEHFDFPELPVLGSTAAGQPIQLGGFSGLFFEGVNLETGAYRFITHPDRGPNAEPQPNPAPGGSGNVRPFPLPDFQSQWVRFEWHPGTGDIAVTETVGLTDPDGIPLTGLPNLAGLDEAPVDVFGNPLPLDPLGADMEGIARAEDGTWWMVDEYRPAIYHFDATGKLLKRYVPAGVEASPVDSGALPALLATRRANRGFEAVAIQNGRVYAFVQSPLRNPNAAASTASGFIRIVEFDPMTETTTGMFLYALENGLATGKTALNGSDKIGDAVASPIPGEFYVLERDDVIGPDAVKNIFRIQVAGATNLLGLDESLLPKAPEQMKLAELSANGIQPVAKELLVDLAALGYDLADKPEGLALIDYNTLVVINDNDFGLAGDVDFATGLIGFQNPQQPIRLAVIDLQGNALDASDRDGRINFVNWPVFGMYQPDAIAAFAVKGKTYYVTANEGDAREYIYEDENGEEVEAFVEEARVRSLTLDPVAFPNRDELRDNANLGRLTVTTTLGDADGDGLFEELYVLGGRSFSVWDAHGKLVYDSGDLLEKLTALADPANFNANNDENDTFDNRSDNKGSEPEGLVIGEVLGRPFAFIGLERVGGVMVFDLSNPTAPRFVQYLNNRDFNGDPEAGTAGDLGPEGLAFIPWWQSPTWKPLLVVGNEVSGTTTIYELAVTPATAP
jgi:hypothetical protein